MYTIKYNFEQKGLEPVVLAMENNIELHHNCGMVCACSTCHVYLDKGEDLVPEITDKEEDFIDRARNPRLSSRLSCQLYLQKGGSGTIEVTVPDQSLIHGD
jgi:2Fe-2S ferredoxin